MIFELINPSDAVTFHAEGIQVAQAVCLLAGDGTYGLRDERGELPSPFIAFMGKVEAEAALKSIFGDFTVFIHDNREGIASALDSAICVEMSKRKEFDDECAGFAHPDKLRRFKEQTNQRNRSSLSDISSKCWDLARKLRGLCTEEEAKHERFAHP